MEKDTFHTNLSYIYTYDLYGGNLNTYPDVVNQKSCYGSKTFQIQMLILKKKKYNKYIA